MAKNSNNKINDFDIPLIKDNVSNSILTQNKKVELKTEEKAKLFEYFVINPINLLNKSRKAYNLKEEKGIDFTQKGLRQIIKQIYDFDNNDKFYMLKPTDTINKMSEWYKNGEFPCNDVVIMERICIKNTYGNSKIPALIWFVRNCLCHGNFEVVLIGKSKKYLVLEDNTSTIVRGRGCIQINTLFNLINAILNYE